MYKKSTNICIIVYVLHIHTVTHTCTPVSIQHNCISHNTHPGRIRYISRQILNANTLHSYTKHTLHICTGHVRKYSPDNRNSIWCETTTIKVLYSEMETKKRVLWSFTTYTHQHHDTCEWREMDTHTHTHVHTQMHTNALMHALTHAHARTLAHMHTRTHTHMHTHTRTHTHKVTTSSISMIKHRLSPSKSLCSILHALSHIQMWLHENCERIERSNHDSRGQRSIMSEVNTGCLE